MTAWELAAGLADLMGRSQQTCRHFNVSDTVQVVEHVSADGDARAALHGVNTCKSPLCALCAPKWQRTRSDEISQAIEYWEEQGAGRVFFVTTTMRHNRKMRLSLMQRLLTHAWGHIWSGRRGQEAAEMIGGKPEGIRAHDRTWSNARGWHPHEHSLLFVQNVGVDDRELADVIDQRWRESLESTLKSFKSQALRILAGDVCGWEDCAECARPKAERGECPHLRERATRLFGAKLVPRWKKTREGKRAPASLHDSMRQILHDLKPFTAESIKPTAAHGVFVERMRDVERLPRYLAKMGLELASSLTKMGKAGTDGIMHFGLWEVARLACSPDHDLQKPARNAWRDLFHATFGTQSITFSNRERLGLEPDPYAEDAEPPEASVKEDSSCIGEIEGAEYRRLTRERGHAVVGEIMLAYQRGELDSLAYVRPLSDAAAGLQEAVRRRELASAARAEALLGTALEGMFDAPARETRAEHDRRQAERERRAEARGAEVMADAWAEATKPEPWSVSPDQVRRDLARMIGARE
jgi:hypothetical protein